MISSTRSVVAAERVAAISFSTSAQLSISLPKASGTLLNLRSIIANKMARDNVEAFLIDEADRNGAFPNTLNQLVKTGVLKPREINLEAGEKLFYKKTSDKAY